MTVAPQRDLKDLFYLLNCTPGLQESRAAERAVRTIGALACCHCDQNLTKILAKVDLNVSQLPSSLTASVSATTYSPFHSLKSKLKGTVKICQNIGETAKTILLAHWYTGGLVKS